MNPSATHRSRWIRASAILAAAAVLTPWPAAAETDTFIHTLRLQGAGADDEAEWDAYIDGVASAYPVTHGHKYSRIEDLRAGVAAELDVKYSPMEARGLTFALTIERPLDSQPYPSLDAMIKDERSGVQAAFAALSNWAFDNLSTPMLLRPFHEFLGGGSDWLDYSGPQGHQQAWQRLHQIVNEGPGGHLIKWVWDPNAPSDEMGNGLNAYWPGAEYVDYIGQDFHKAAAEHAFMMATLPIFARHKGRPIYIAEFSPNNQRSFPQGIRTPGVKRHFYTPFTQWMLDNRDVVAGTAFQNSSGTDEDDLLITAPDLSYLFAYWERRLAQLGDRPAVPCDALQTGVPTTRDANSTLGVGAEITGPEQIPPAASRPRRTARRPEARIR